LFWLELMVDSKPVTPQRAGQLMKEADELTADIRRFTENREAVIIQSPIAD
jgi:hypothetical protein